MTRLALSSTSQQSLFPNANGLHRFGTGNHDVGPVILDHPVAVGSYGSLAAAGTVDAMPTGAPVTGTGYGVSGEKPAVVSYRERLMADAFVVNTHNTPSGGTNVQLSTNPGDGRGGTCFGDSGGPILAGDTNTIIGVNSFVLNGQCAGVGFAYRTDQAAVISWVQAHAVGPVSVG